jgi:hypothetical protein
MVTVEADMRRNQAIILTMGLALASGAIAAPKPMGEPPVVQSLLDCRKLTDSTARLACYDKATDAIQSATASGDLVSIDREQRKAARRQAFGFTLPTLSFLDRGEKEADRLSATVADASQDPYGKWIIRLDDGAVWMQTEPDTLARPPHKGSKVNISKGMMGGFFMTIDGEAAGKATRQS